jgi:hypothetical protein
VIGFLWAFVGVVTIVAALVSASAFAPRLPVVRPVALATRPAPAVTAGPRERDHLPART